MTESKDFTFAIFLKSCYEVRPKKHPTQTKSHHWKLRIDPFNPRTNIRRVEFILHETFEEPIQIKKEPPYEIREDGFGNFQMHINVKILNRIIPIPYNIVLTNERSENVQIHYSIWSVKPKELRKVLEIGGIPIDDYNNESEQCRALNRISDILSKHEGHSFDNTKFYPKAFERVQKVLLEMDSLNERDRAPSEESTLSRHTTTSIPPMLHHKTHQSEHTNKHRKQHSGKDTDKSPKYSMTNNLVKSTVTGKESKKDVKSKKRQRDSSSESDFTELANNTSINTEHSGVKKVKKDKIVRKEPKLDSQKAVCEKVKNSQIEVPQKPILSSTSGSLLPNIDSSAKIKPVSTDKLPMKSKSEKPNALVNPIVSKPKVKSKEHLNNPPSDLFSKIFDAPDTIVLNKGKANLAKDKRKSSSKVPKHNPLIKKTKNLPIGLDDNINNIGHKKSFNSSVGGFNKKDDDTIRSMSESPSKIMKSKMIMPSKKIPDQSQPSKLKWSKSEIELQSKLFDDSDESNDGINNNNHNNNNNSDFSSSDDDLDPSILGPKKGGAIKKTPTESPIDPTKVGVKQLFGDDDDDDEDEEGEDEDGVENDGGDRRNPVNYNGVTSETNADNSVSKSVKNEEIELNNNTINGNNTATAQSLYSYDDRQKLAQKLAKLHNDEFYDKFQRLMLVMYQNHENSVRLDEEMMMHFDLELLSDQYIGIIVSMVDEYCDKNDEVMTKQNNQHQHHRHDKHRRRQKSNNYSNNTNNCEDVHK